MAYFSKYDLTEKYVKLWPCFMTLWLYDFWVPLVITKDFQIWGGILINVNGVQYFFSTLFTSQSSLSD